MNCPYCKQPNDDVDEGPPYKIYLCKRHPDCMIEYPEPNPLGNWIGIFHGNYLIELNKTDNQTALYNLMDTHRNPDDYSCVRLNYLIDLTPESVKEWIDRLLKFRIFQ